MIGFRPYNGIRGAVQKMLQESIPDLEAFDKSLRIGEAFFDVHRSRVLRPSCGSFISLLHNPFSSKDGFMLRFDLFCH
jgi:hypothetical protein